MFAKCCETKDRNQLGKGETRVQPIFSIYGTYILTTVYTFAERHVAHLDQDESLGRFEEMLVEATDPCFFATRPSIKAKLCQPMN